MPEREYLGGSVETTTVGETSDTATSINIADPTGWPLGGVNGPFWATINHRMSNEERVEVESRTGNTLNNVTRAQDNTPASVHANNSPIHHGPAAVDFQEFNDHINTTVDPHDEYMLADGTRHDLTARHEAGVSLPTAVPESLDADVGDTEGVSTSVARADHVHAVPTAAPVDISTSNLAGVATSFSRSDHQHQIGTGAIDDIAQLTSPVLIDLGLNVPRPNAGVKSTTNRSYTENVVNTMIFTSGEVEWDSTPAISDSANDRFVITETGLWRTSLWVFRDSTANVTASIAIQRNGSDVVAGTLFQSGIFGWTDNISIEDRFTAGDFITAAIFQTNGGGGGRVFQLRNFTVSYMGP